MAPSGAFLLGRDMRKEKDEVPRQMLSYTPNRFEYFAGQALQGLVVGRSEQNIKKWAKLAVELAREMENEVDS